MVHQGNNSSTIYAENDALERIPNYPKGHAKGLKKKKKKKRKTLSSEFTLMKLLCQILMRGEGGWTSNGERGRVP